MSQQELTQQQLDRQSFVDNAIQELFELLAPKFGLIEWNIEAIAQVRDAIKQHLVDRLGLMTEQEFYPFLEEKVGGREANHIVVDEASQLKTVAAKPRVEIEVWGGVASVVKCPDWIEVEIRDYDTELIFGGEEEEKEGE
ncbi:MAG: hypothetical protein BroJett011_33820 [Chloroflexota bacterium]|nr:MAG: hypothetical protein BroJett011_33820 [Chloroflexota bacterium]